MKRFFLVLSVLLVVACGTSARQQVPTGPSRPTEAPKPTATPRGQPPSTTQPPPLKPSARAGTALEWYPLAEKVAMAWQADAVLRSVNGGNVAGDGSSMPCDGKAELWNYTFVSIAAQKTLLVFVEAGAVKSKSETALTRLDGKPASKEDLEFYSQLYPASDWKVDSPQAATTANALFKAKYNVEPRHIAYVMFNTKYLDFVNNKAINWMQWVISYDPEKYPFQVSIDARTGEVKERP